MFTSQFGSESSNRFHCCFTIFLVGGLGSSCQLHAIKCEEVTFNKNPSLWDLFNRVDNTDILAIQPFHPLLFIEIFINRVHGDVFPWNQPSSILASSRFRRLWRGVSLGTFRGTGVCMFNGLGREGRFGSRRRRLGVGSTGASR